MEALCFGFPFMLCNPLCQAILPSLHVLFRDLCGVCMLLLDQWLVPSKYILTLPQQHRHGGEQMVVVGVDVVILD